MNGKFIADSSFFGAEGKIVQIGQTEGKSFAFYVPDGVQRYAERQSLFKTQSN